MAARRRWSTEEILDTATELLRTGDPESFSVRQLAVALGTDSSSLYRHFRNKTDLLREISDRVIVTALEGYVPDGDWRQRMMAVGMRLWDAFGQHPQLAAIWGRYASSGSGSRLTMELALQALRDSGLPEEEIPAQYHRLATLLVALIATGAGAVDPEEYEQGRELFRVAVLGADPDRFPALAHFARDLQPVKDDRRAAFADIISAHLDLIEARIPAGRA